MLIEEFETEASLIHESMIMTDDMDHEELDLNTSMNMSLLTEKDPDEPYVKRPPPA